MRRLVIAVAAASLACSRQADLAAGDEAATAAYLSDARARRAALVESLVNPANRYSALRLARYATGAADDWELLPVWNPPVTDAARPRASTGLPLDDEERTLPPAALHALGEAAFFRYPVQFAPAMPPLTRELASRYGLWWSESRGVGGLVSVDLPDGSAALAFTCATCHAQVAGTEVVAGLANADLQLGMMIVDAGGATDPDASVRILAWGPGRVDVTTSEGTLPERIPDLRPVRWLSHLQYDATMRQVNLVSLAIRVETLIVTSHGLAVRPPRIVALALAQFLWDMGDTLPTPLSDGRGAEIFVGRCGHCHAGPGLTGLPVALDIAGTDPTLGRSPDRGTGLYRVPSLRGLAARATLLHDGSVRSLGELLNPARLNPDYPSGARGPGPVPGHAFGLDLGLGDRTALLGFLNGL